LYEKACESERNSDSERGPAATSFHSTSAAITCTPPLWVCTKHRPCGGTCLVCFILHLLDIVTQVCWAGVGYAAAAAVVGATGWSRRRLMTNPGGGPWQAYTHFLACGLQRQPAALAASRSA